MRNVYMDNNATTPIHPEVQEAIKQALPIYGNASSHHAFGEEARERVEDARAKLAQLINADPSEIIFTSCGSESNNLVLKGVTCEYVACKPKDAPGGRHLITSQIEHPSVKNTSNCLEQRGFKVTWLPVDEYGLVDPEDLKKAITRQTVLVSIMLGNNEIGTLEPVQELCAIAREHGVYFHTDAVQALGKVKVDVKELGVDFLSLSGHKLYAPKGIGALYLKKGRMICPLFHGGHQEGGLRVGTENTLGIIALGKAAELAQSDMGREVPQIQALRDRLKKGIAERVPDVKFNGHPDKVLPGTLNVSFLYVEGESILLRLSGQGIAVSTGSACSSGTLDPSHVLLALGLSHEVAHGSIRFSLGRENTAADVDYVLDVLPGVIADLRKMSPLSRAKAAK